MKRFELGRLIWAVIPDLNGYAKPNPRPAMVTQQVDANDDDLIPVIVGSTRVVDPPPDDQVVIHSTYQQDPVTKLSRPTALILTWIAAVKCSDIQRLGGIIRGKRAHPIIKKSLELLRPPNK